MNINNLPERLFNLLIDNGYDKLSEKDKSEIEKYIAPEEYDSMQQFVQQFLDVDESLENSIKSNTSLQENIIKKPNLMHRIINYSVPLYKVAAIFIISIGLFALYQNKDALIKKTTFANVEKNLSIKDGFYPENLKFEL